MLLPLDARVALGTLQLLAERQGRSVEPTTEEQPGRILHEIRSGLSPAGVPGRRHRLLRHGRRDAPLRHARGRAAGGGGTAAGRPRTVAARTSIARSTGCETYGDRDGDGFVEYERATPHGLVNQGWKDSFDGITHADGRSPHAPIALAEVQGYVYGALRARSELADAFGDRERAGAAAAAGRCPEADLQRQVLAPGPRPPRPRPRRGQAAGRRHSHPTWVTACGPASSTRSTPPTVAAALISPEMFSGCGRAHPGLVDGRLQPDELPQRLGLAARQRPGRGGAAAVRVRRGGPAGRRAASSTPRRRSAAGSPSCSAASTVTAFPGPIPYPDRLLSPGVGGGHPAAPAASRSCGLEPDVPAGVGTVWPRAAPDGELPWRGPARHRRVGLDGGAGRGARHRLPGEIESARLESRRRARERRGVGSQDVGARRRSRRP